MTTRKLLSVISANLFNHLPVFFFPMEVIISLVWRPGFASSGRILSNVWWPLVVPSWLNNVDRNAETFLYYSCISGDTNVSYMTSFREE